MIVVYDESNPLVGWDFCIFVVQLFSDAPRADCCRVNTDTDVEVLQLDYDQSSVCLPRVFLYVGHGRETITTMVTLLL